jgi:hypothetical protein
VLGTTTEGRTLRTTNGSWAGTTPFTFRYRWLRCDASGGGINGVNCAAIPGETTTAHILTHADVGHTLRSRVAARNHDGAASVVSNPTGVVTSSAGRPASKSPPTISGTPQQGQMLAAHHGTWSGAQPIAFAYQWTRCDQTGGSCSNITGATSTVYALKSVDIGNTLRIRITARNSLGSRASTSAPTAVIVRAGAPAGAAISVADVSLPNRLIVDRLSYEPSTARPGEQIIARYRVSDSHDHRVAGALVFVVGIPFGVSTTPAEALTGPDGWVTFSMRATSRVGRGGIVYFVRARKPGEPLLAGVSTRRLTYLPGR